MKKSTFFVSICYTLIFYCCHANTTRYVKTDDNKYFKDTISKDIPLNEKGDTVILYRLVKQDARELHLDSLELGYDSLQIRIWCNYGTLKTRHLIVIERKLQDWHAKLITLIYEWNNDINKVVIKNIDIKEVQPESGWNPFIKKLLALEIITLPSMNKIQGSKTGSYDSDIYSVEIATKKNYRFYWYEQPKKYENQFWQARNMEKILQLIEKEFEFKRLNN